MPKKRIIKFRNVSKRILILCEGKYTEPLYFKGIRKSVSLKNKLSALRIEIYDSEKNTGKELVEEAKFLMKEAKQDKNDYEEVWIVIDKDGYTKFPQTFDNAYKIKIKIAFSIVAFEIWFLLHFRYTSKYYHNYSELEKDLIKEISDYSKSNDNLYEILKGRMEFAIQNAKKLNLFVETDIQNGKKHYELNCSYTNVHELVSLLHNL